MTKAKGVKSRDTLMIDLALQGGGSHGAFTWGVLDRLLEVPWLEIEGISGTSAGAMNAAVLAHGIATGGRVLSVVGRGENFAEARARAYAAIELIGLEGGQYRTDIAARVA